ncbi:MAG: hypothetical protein ABIK39_02440 [candidate division WOR-3 bacterium]
MSSNISAKILPDKPEGLPDIFRIEEGKGWGVRTKNCYVPCCQEAM